MLSIFFLHISKKKSPRKKSLALDFTIEEKIFRPPLDFGVKLSLSSLPLAPKHQLGELFHLFSQGCVKGLGLGGKTPHTA